MSAKHLKCLQRAEFLHLRLSKIEGTQHQLQIKVKLGPYPCKLLPLQQYLLKEKKKKRRNIERKPKQQIHARGAQCCQEAKDLCQRYS